MSNSIELILGNDEQELSQLFSYTQEEKSHGVSLTDYIAHTFNQTLQRDMFFGSWADVWYDKGEIGLKISSPKDDISSYSKIIPQFLDAARTALKIFNENKEAIEEEVKKTGMPLDFLLPFGLTMVNTRSIQLLHFPPIETFTYLDYLYSPTNRRWENLLGYNEYQGEKNTLVERIVDCVPLAAPGGDSTGIAPFNNTFIPYGCQMLKALLDASGNATQPIVAYGSPVRHWLEAAFPNQVKDLGVLSLCTLKLFDNDVSTPVLCANHPSEYLYYTGKPSSEEKTKIMTQDLIAAGWQTAMCVDWSADPHEKLSNSKDFWGGNPDKVQAIIEQQDVEFGYGH